jgi:3-isopropylmalate dehydrogenase
MSDPATSGWLEAIREPTRQAREHTALIGVLAGEGVGPEVTGAALEVLRALEQAGGRQVAVEHGGPIGLAAKRIRGSALPREAIEFCSDVFDRGGAILNGPGGGRYVYDLRKRLELFLKISPIQVRNGLVEPSPLRPERLTGVDLLVVRENLGGVYQGRSGESESASGGREIHHELAYGQRDVRRFLAAAARLASSRRGELTVVIKDAGLEQFSALWCECAQEAAARYGVRWSAVDVDLMVYRLMERPASFDVIACSNLFGDVLSDLAAVALGARGLSFSGNFTPRGDGVYQTNHGSAHDIAGSDRANPAGQILSLAMLLRESLGMEREADACEAGLRRVWADGVRTADVPAGGERIVGTAEMASLVAEAAADELTVAVQPS